MTSSSTSSPPRAAADYSAERAAARTVAVTLGWWAHGVVRVLLAAALLYYGFAKLVLGQFGVADMGDALITQGEMSPMGMLWRMVALSPLFQILGGLAEAGAAVALLWRRSVSLGAVIGAADMALVLVLNLGYDVPVKQIALAMLVMSLLVLIPWMPRLARAFLGRGAIGPGPRPTLVPWRPLARVTDVLGPIAGAALVVAIGVGVAQMYPERSTDTTAPAGVWTVVEDTAEPAAQLADDERWSALAFGEVRYDDRAAVQLRRANGELLTGTYERRDGGTIELALTPLREEGQPVAEHLEAEPERLELRIEERKDGTLHVTGQGQDLVLAPDTSGTMLYERGFSWTPRPDDPFNR
ncbi:hypothetical protein [Brachybacterium sp. YJGR34]|uniref:hypothetical protein n=1 Tax=Brachybacterium sp. YJGR34 TaxID=2059911 RepID=UPI000E0C5A23|nr:hypothetical protein [Brachybacterium sp. YJGR34]